MSASAGWVGMKIATYANVRVSNTARQTKDIGKTLKVALKGGSVMGLCVGGFALLGLFLVYIIFVYGLGHIKTESLIEGQHVFTQCLSCYALGCSIVAMFKRVGGGLYTMAGDLGAAAALSFENRNVFKGAESSEISFESEAINAFGSFGRS